MHNTVNVTALPEPIYAGDWHDSPLRWTVQGPGTEIQNFSTKKDANTYARIRRKSKSFTEASLAYSKTY